MGLVLLLPSPTGPEAPRGLTPHRVPCLSPACPPPTSAWQRLARLSDGAPPPGGCRSPGHPWVPVWLSPSLSPGLCGIRLPSRASRASGLTWCREALGSAEQPWGLGRAPIPCSRSVQFSRSVLSDCDPLDCSTPGLPVGHLLPGRGGGLTVSAPSHQPACIWDQTSLWSEAGASEELWAGEKGQGFFQGT